VQEEGRWRFAVLFGLACIIVLAILRYQGMISEENFVTIVIMIITALLGIKRGQGTRRRSEGVGVLNAMVVCSGVFLAINAVVTGAAAALDFRGIPLAVFVAASLLQRATCARIWWI